MVKHWSDFKTTWWK